jgi:hypothetical protein
MLMKVGGVEFPYIFISRPIAGRPIFENFTRDRTGRIFQRWYPLVVRLREASILMAVIRLLMLVRVVIRIRIRIIILIILLLLMLR